MDQWVLDEESSIDEIRAKIFDYHHKDEPRVEMSVGHYAPRGGTACGHVSFDDYADIAFKHFLSAHFSGHSVKGAGRD